MPPPRPGIKRPPSVNDDDDENSNIDVGAKKSKNQDTQHDNASQQLSNLSQEAIDIINSIATNPDQHMPVEEDNNISQLKIHVSELSEIIKSQANEIKSLKARINLIMSFIGINTSSLKALPDLKNLSNDHNEQNALEPSSKDEVPTNDIDGNHTLTPHDMNTEAWSTINKKTNTKVTNNIMKSNLCQSVVSAMYVDQRQKDQRANSFVISGLPSEDDVDDKVKVKHICRYDLKTDNEPEILKVRRIGNPSPGKIQPLLVILKQKIQAQEIVAKARMLRNSSSDYTRTNIYINPNLTRAESAAAYQLRCQRRHNKTLQNGENALTSHSNPANQNSAQGLQL